MCGRCLPVSGGGASALLLGKLRRERRRVCYHSAVDDLHNQGFCSFKLGPSSDIIMAIMNVAEERRLSLSFEIGKGRTDTFEGNAWNRSFVSNPVQQPPYWHIAATLLLRVRVAGWVTVGSGSFVTGYLSVPAA